MRALVMILGLLLAGPLAAQTTELRALDTDYAAASWKAVGRVDFGRGAFCSGTLIAPDLVLTAAHCLYQPGTDRLWPTDSIRFRAGLRNGQAVAERTAIAAAAHERFDPVGPLNPGNVANDVALIRLAERISTFEVPPFHLQAGDLDPGPVSVVSYGRGRAEAQSRQKECQFEARHSDVLIFDCDVTFGSSGSPVFSHRDGRGQIVSVISGLLSFQGEQKSFGMVLPDRVAEVKRQLGLQERTPTAQVRRITVGGGNRTDIGAKFVRP